MKEDLTEIERIINEITKESSINLQNVLMDFLKKHVTRSHIDKFIGDYPTFIEPVYLEDNVKIGDDVLLGPNVYIGTNSEIGDYTEASNTIIFDNVKIGENFKLNNCIITRNSSLNFKNLNVKNCILTGSASSEEELHKIKF